LKQVTLTHVAKSYENQHIIQYAINHALTLVVNRAAKICSFCFMFKYNMS